METKTMLLFDILKYSVTHVKTHTKHTFGDQTYIWGSKISSLHHVLLITDFVISKFSCICQPNLNIFNVSIAWFHNHLIIVSKH